jgi:hypothetical protein
VTLLKDGHRTIERGLPLQESAPARFGAGALTKDPIPVPFEHARQASGGEHLPKLALGETDGVVGLAQPGRCMVAAVPDAGQFSLRCLELLATQVEERSGTESKVLHDEDGDDSASSAASASA